MYVIFKERKIGNAFYTLKHENDNLIKIQHTKKTNNNRYKTFLISKTVF